MAFSIVAAGGGLIDVNFATVAWAWVVFLVTFWCLKRVAWPMLQEKMEEREVIIREGLERAEEAERRARELMEKQEAILQASRDEAQGLLAEARSAAENIKNETVAKAQAEIGAERDRARKEIGLERAKAIDELKRAAVDLTLEAAGRVLERELRDEDHRRLATEVIDSVDSLR